MMGWLFGTPKPESTAPASSPAPVPPGLADTIAQQIAGIKQQIKENEDSRDKYLKQARANKQVAIEEHQKGNQKSAIVKLRLAKRYEKQAEQLDGVIENFYNMIFPLEAQQRNMLNVNIMSSYTNTMEAIAKHTNVDKVYDLKDRMEEIMHQQEELEDLLSSTPNSSKQDDAELLAELEEYSAMARVSAGPETTATAATSTATVAAGAGSTAAYVPDLPAVPTQPLPSNTTTTAAAAVDPDLAMLEAALS